MTIFVPGRLPNPLNGSWGHWSKHARQARAWRDRTALAVLVACHGRRLPAELGPPERPKIVSFMLRTWNTLDDDALSACAKPCRDALRDCGIIDDDRPGSGHTFRYSQEIDRKNRGVEIVVLAAGPPRGTDGV